MKPTTTVPEMAARYQPEPTYAGQPAAWSAHRAGAPDRAGARLVARASQAGASQQAVIASVRHEVIVNAPIERAFRVFTDGFGRWWPKNHTIASFPVDRSIIEPWAGGRCFDRGADGSECDWGQVLAWEPPTRLVLAWQVDGTWSYEPEVDNASRVTVSFAALGGQTRLTLVHDEFERHLKAGPHLADGVRDGWGTALHLFADAAGSQSAAGPAARAAPEDSSTCTGCRSPDSPAQPWPTSTVSELVSYRYGMRSVPGTMASITWIVRALEILPSAPT